MERIVPDRLADDDPAEAATLRVHLERYRFAAHHLVPGTVLDLACGVGYGTRALADERAQITRATGVDVCGRSIDYANRRYGSDRIEFHHSDADSFTPPALFDNVVSIETIEHLPDPQTFVGKLVGLLRPGGVLVASVPVTPSVDANPHHLHDFTARQFRRMFPGFDEIASLRQVEPFAPFRVLSRNAGRQSRQRNLVAFYARHPGKLLTRIGSTLQHGFTVHTLSVAWRKR